MTTNPAVDRDITERLVRMETKLDLVLTRTEEDRQKHHTDVAELKGDIDAVNDKIGKLENWKYAATAALLLSGGSGVATILNLGAK